jgi:exopolysaccharide biosynthesis polyprenyl glycosylphosphotransferase
LRRNRLDDLFLVFFNTVTTALLILLIFSYLSSYRFIAYDISRLYLLLYLPIGIFFIFGTRLITFALFKRTALRRNGISKILIAGSDNQARMTAANLKKYRHFGIEVCGFLSSKKGEGVLGDFKDFAKVVEKYGITDLFIALSLKEYSTILKLTEAANNLLIDVRLVPDILQMASIKARMEHIEGIPIIHLGDIPLQGWGLFFKRAFDLGFSFIGLLLLSPLFLLIAVAIKLTSRGPVFYRQERVGLDGRHFRMIKFRTMIKDAEKETGAIWSPPRDSRVTAVGKVLRKLSFDEFPQLLNVFKGDMSLVGPRPERPEFVEKFKHNIPRYMLRHRVRTGMTGWAQVHGLRGNTPLDKRIEYDIYYIQNWSLRLDLEILWRTILKLQFIDREKEMPAKKDDPAD